MVHPEMTNGFLTYDSYAVEEVVQNGAKEIGWERRNPFGGNPGQLRVFGIAMSSIMLGAWGTTRRNWLRRCWLGRRRWRQRAIQRLLGELTGNVIRIMRSPTATESLVGDGNAGRGDPGSPRGSYACGLGRR
jgi:hypothetical protein